MINKCVFVHEFTVYMHVSFCDNSGLLRCFFTDDGTQNAIDQPYIRRFLYFCYLQVTVGIETLGHIGRAFFVSLKLG